MAAGQAAEKAKQWDEAAKAYREALKFIPNDPKAAAALKTADFNVHLEEGKKLHAGKRYPEAVKEFEEALKLFPNDMDARAWLQKAKNRMP
jgi:tetratricopeptide (TPR) repeat protein